jgi:ligand-binding sensor domain-containing protein
LCSNYVNCIVEDKKGNLWFGTQHGGLCRYDPSASKGSPKAFTTFTSKDGLCGKEVWSILEDKTGNLWVVANAKVNPATNRGGVCRYDGKTFTRFTDNEDLLAQNGVQCLVEDKKGVLWLGSTGGLCRFDGKSFINITKEWSLGAL